MDYALAIRRNRDQLKGIVIALFALARMRVGGSLLTLPKSAITAILMVLRPAESALRRLIVIAAHRLKVSAPAEPSRPSGGWPISPLAREMSGRTEGDATLAKSRAFALFDPLKTFDPEAVWDAEPVWKSGFEREQFPVLPDALPADAPTDATHLLQRLNALLRALDTIPYQARRLKRWQARRDAALKAYKSTRLSPMRPGFPPGWRQRRIHEIDDVLKECHGLANDLMSAPDSS